MGLYHLSLPLFLRKPVGFTISIPQQLADNSIYCWLMSKMWKWCSVSCWRSAQAFWRSWHMLPLSQKSHNYTQSLTLIPWDWRIFSTQIWGAAEPPVLSRRWLGERSVPAASGQLPWKVNSEGTKGAVRVIMGVHWSPARLLLDEWVWGQSAVWRARVEVDDRTPLRSSTVGCWKRW